MLHVKIHTLYRDVFMNNYNYNPGFSYENDIKQNIMHSIQCHNYISEVYNKPNRLNIG